jgi:hypothetical protein
MASVKQFQVTFDCAEPERAARFWYEMLGYVVPPPPEGSATWNGATTMTAPQHVEPPAAVLGGPRTCELGVSNCIGRRTVRGSTTLRDRKS